MKYTDKQKETLKKNKGVSFVPGSGKNGKELKIIKEESGFIYDIELNDGFYIVESKLNNKELWQKKK